MATNIPIEPSGGPGGEILTYISAVATMEFSNNGHTVLLVKIGAAGAGNLTITSRKCSHGRTSDIVKALANNDNFVAGPFAPELWNDDAGKVQIAFSVVAGNTVTAVQQGT